MKSYAQVLGLDQNNRKDGTNETIAESNPNVVMTKTINVTKQNKEKSLQQTIDKMQNQINKLINLVTELTKSVISDETKKMEIMQQMNGIKDVEKIYESSDV